MLPNEGHRKVDVSVSGLLGDVTIVDVSRLRVKVLLKN